MAFLKLSEQERLGIFERVRERINLPAVAIEKDWWVTTVLRALFALPYAENLSFKGGTSLSKCWNTIERFSEDVDIAVNREFLGFNDPLSKTQIKDKLRRASCSFVRERLQFDLDKQLVADGIDPSLFSVKVNITSVTTTDPEIIEVEYKSLLEGDAYIKRSVILEVSGRSMKEPLKSVEVKSMVDEAFPNTPFTGTTFNVQAVVPQRTFIEKICLLHEEFAKPQDEVRSERMSRHLYDLVQMMGTSIADEALSDKELYNSIVEHRRTFIGLKGFNYDTLAPQHINIIPPPIEIDKWKSDYETMQQTMIYGDSLPFDKLMDKIKELNEKVKMSW
jgi:predicted nucleotidyltransferase component of viral defense system